MESATWRAPVRFAEVDPQGVVFNPHYLTYCDEALTAFFAQIEHGADDAIDFATSLKVVTTTLTWSAPARNGDVIEIYVRCTKVGRTSLSLAFDIRAGQVPCCEVSTTYVHVDHEGIATAIPAAI